MLAELVDEQFAVQYGYVYALAQTAACSAYAFGPLFGGILLNQKWLRFESLMHLVGGANLMLALITFVCKRSHYYKVQYESTARVENGDEKESIGHMIMDTQLEKVKLPDYLMPN